MNNFEILIEGAKKFGIELSEKQIKQFKDYKDLIIEWNQKVNLTAITEEKEIFIKHFLDSIACVNLDFVEKAESIIDIGTGAGFPGIPIAIIFPGKKIVLVDSLNKRVNFLDLVIENLGLDNVEAYHGRAEDFGHNEDMREQFDVVVSRAVAKLNVLAEYCMPFLKKGGRFISYKAVKAEEEIEDSQKAIALLGGHIERTETVNILGMEMDHKLVIIEKLEPTSEQYPRRSGKPTKKPL